MISLHFRALGPQDCDALNAIVSDWDVVRQLGSWPYPSDPAFTLSRCQPYPGNGFVWGVFTDAGLVGSVSVTEGELGYMLGRQVWGQGVGTRTVAAALQHGFGQYTFDRITASVWADNAGSAHVLEKNGLTQTHQTTEMAKARGVVTPAIYYAISRETHDTLRAGAE